MAGKLRIVVAEDSATVRESLVSALDATPDMRVVAAVSDGEQAIQAVRDISPDAITMDVNMPGMDGLKAARFLMQEHPIPIVIVSSALDDQEIASFRALEAGALAFVRTPPGRHDPTHRAAIADLVQIVRLMAEVKVVRRRNQSRPVPPPRRHGYRAHKIELVAIGASTGGPLAVREFLAALPKDLATPILLVQHMTAGFLDGFVRWLHEATGYPIAIAADGERLRSGYVHIAPDGRHLGVDRWRRVVLSDAPPEQGLRPSVSHLFRAARSAYGAQVAAILLSGMGKDGADELLALRDAGAVTFAQSFDSSIVFGMPGEAVRLGAASFVMSSAEIAAALANMISLGPK
jgi:two-component system chemotaxis response regulator CheB